jgi:hypothetical protein
MFSGPRRNMSEYAQMWGHTRSAKPWSASLSVNCLLTVRSAAAAHSDDPLAHWFVVIVPALYPSIDAFITSCAGRGIWKPAAVLYVDAQLPGPSFLKRPADSVTSELSVDGLLPHAMH